MEQIICDICGCEYAQTMECCPVCGYPRQGTEKTAAAADTVERKKVKGGRFSARNVRKRQKAQDKAAVTERERSDKPLLVVIALLLVAIAFVSFYICQRFIWGSGNAFGSDREQVRTTAPAASTSAPAIRCKGIRLNSYVIELDEPGQTWKLELTLTPDNTTDTLNFASSDENVVKVSEDGTLTAVGPGQAVVTITCGSMERSCTVVCWSGETTVPAETTAPAETAAPTEAPKPTESGETEAPVLTLDPNDASCFSTSESFTIYPRFGGSSVSRSKVTWSTSDSAVAVVENGVVTPVGKGTATITAVYEGKKATCTVRCRFEDPVEQEDRNDPEEPADQTWKASHSDVSIRVGESFRLSVKNSDGETADAIWTMSVDGVVSVNGGTITGRDRGTVTLTTEVEGDIFTCIVRVN